MITDDQHRSQSRPSTAALLGAPLALLAGPFATVLLPSDAIAAPETFTVTTLDTTGVGSLTEAISESESNPGADTIVFDPALTGTISLSSEFVISQDLVIDGDQRITLNGGGAVRHFDLQPNDQTLTLRGLTLMNGTNDATGGSVNVGSDANLIIERSTFTGNSVTNPGGTGGAIFVGTNSNLSIDDSTFTGNSSRGGGGAAITFSTNVTGDFTMTRTTISGNASYAGGAVYGDASRVSIVDSVISNNITTADIGSAVLTSGANLAGEYIHVDGLVMNENQGTALDITRGGFVDVDARRLAIDGAARGLFLGTRDEARIRVSNSSITNTSVIGILADSCDADIIIESTTVTGNSGTAIAPEGGSYYCGDHTTFIRHSTIAGNGIGIGVEFEASRTELDHTIVAGNVGDLETDVNARWSLIQRPNGHLLSALNTLVDVDPLLGPATSVGALLVRTFDDSSPAFNAGDPAFAPPPTTDEVGQARVAFGRIDIGAWELQPTDPVAPSFTG